MSFDVLSEINYLAVAVAALAYFVVGALWYLHPFFGKAWQAATGLTQEQTGRPNPMLFVWTFVLYFLMATVLAAIARSTGATELEHGVVLGLFTGVGLVTTSIAIGHMYELRSGKLTLINGGNAIVGHLVMAVIVTIWV